MLLSLLALLVTGFLGYTIFKPSETQQVVVPDVVGATQEDAVAELEAVNLTSSIEPEVTEDEDRVGTVLAQDPPGNSRLDEGGLVTLTIGQAPGDVEVPTGLVGMPVQDARAAIAEAGLTVGTEDYQDSDRDEGEVLEADPAPGSRVAPGTAINLVVSTGEQTVEMPDLIGLNRKAAENELDRLGLDYDIVEQPTGDQPKGTVLQQTPEAGKTLRVGDTVTITVAKEAENPDPPPSTEPPGGEWGDEDGDTPPTDDPTDPPGGGDNGGEGGGPPGGGGDDD